MSPTKRQCTVFKQLVNLLPRNLVAKVARKHGVDKQSRSFSPWSHVVSLIYGQVCHAMSLNDVCDGLRNNSKALGDIRGAAPPSRNGLSHANRVRDAKMAEDLFWEVYAHLQELAPEFGHQKEYRGVPHRFRRAIHAVDSSTIKLVANCMAWAQHRRRKAAAKMHLQLNLQTFLPSCCIVKAASTHDAVEAPELCANLKAGEIVIFDRAYVDFSHLARLDERGVFWVTRMKANIQYEVVGQHRPAKGNVSRDVIIRLVGKDTSEQYPQTLRLVEATVEVDGKMQQMIFITNNFEWASSSVCDLYKSRWGIEVFFKQIKQTLQIADFLGHNENAVAWQVWIALLVYILLRFTAYTQGWAFSCARLFTVLRGIFLGRFDLKSVLDACGTAYAPRRMRANPEQAFLPGFSPG